MAGGEGRFSTDGPIDWELVRPWSQSLAPDRSIQHQLRARELEQGTDILKLFVKGKVTKGKS